MDAAPIAESLSIGVVIGGVTEACKAWQACISAFSVGVIEARVGSSSAVNVNIVFVVPGPVLTSEFDGVRVGRYSHKRRLLLVQVALPELPPEDPAGYLRETAHAALRKAAAWAEQRGIGADFATHHAIVDDA